MAVFLFWTVVLVYLAVTLAYAGLLLHRAVRRLARGHHLDAVLLRARLRRRRGASVRVESLERRIVWSALAAGIIDRSQHVVRLPDTVEVLVAPADLRKLRSSVQRLRADVIGRLLALARVAWCELRVRPVVSLVEDPARTPGRPTIRLSFGGATEEAIRPGHNGHQQHRRGTAPRAYLRPVRPPGEPMPLRTGDYFRIGRLPTCHLVIDQGTVSRLHAVVYERDGAWYISDEGSTNGTFVNLVPVESPVRLTNADEIRVSPTVSLRFELRPSSRSSVFYVGPRRPDEP
jgi:FHA domain